MFERDVYLSVIYCLCCVKYILTDVLEEQVLEEIGPDLNEEEDIRMADSMEEHWSGVDDNGEYKSKFNSLRWYINTKEKEYLIKREFLVTFLHPKGGGTVWTCVKYNIIEEKEDYEAIGLCGIDYKLFEAEEDEGF